MASDKSTSGTARVPERGEEVRCHVETTEGATTVTGTVSSVDEKTDVTYVYVRLQNGKKLRVRPRDIDAGTDQ